MKPTVVFTPTARPTFDVEAAAALADEAVDLLEELGAEVHRCAGLVMAPDEIAGARSNLHAVERPDLIVHACASFSDAAAAVELYRDVGQPVLLWAFREPGEVGQRLLLNSLCGANLAGHALVAIGVDVRLCYGDPAEVAVRHTMASALVGELPARATLSPSHDGRGSRRAARRALHAVRGRRIGVLGDAPTGFTPSAYDEGLLGRKLGLRAESMKLDDLFADVRRVDEGARQAEVVAAHEWQPSLEDLDPDAVDRSAAVTVALREWRDAAGLSALAVRCWPEFPEELGVCPCGAMARLADEATPALCERDVYGAATALIMEELGSGPTYLVDTVEVIESNNVVRFWHCGSAPTALAADPAEATQSVHCNRRIGVAGDFGLRSGPVVVARLAEDPEGTFRMLIAAGTALAGPNRFQGNTVDVALEADAIDFVTALVTGGFPHHTVLAWRDVRPCLRAVADELGIPVIEFAPAGG